MINKYRQPHKYKKPNKFEPLYRYISLGLIGALLGFVLAVLYQMGVMQGIY